MNCYVYILQSEKTGNYYVGQAENVNVRLNQHNNGYKSHFTSRDQPWVLKAELKCSDRNHAMRLEAFIKKQKNKVRAVKFISSLFSFRLLILPVLNRFK